MILIAPFKRHFKMAGINFQIPLALFFTALTMFNHCKAPPPLEPDPSRANISSSITGNATSSMEPPQPTEAPTRPPNMQHCNEYLPLLPKNNRSCTDGHSEHYICYPLALSDGVVDVARNLNIKPSRRFRISAINSESNEAAGTCPTNAGSRNFGAEFLRGPDTLLEDYHQLFMDLVEDLGWQECRMKVATTGPIESTTGTMNVTITSKTTETTTTPKTTITTPTTTAMTTTTTTTTGPAVMPVKEVPKSHRLTRALENGCAIIINATLPPNGTFTIQLLHNMPEPIPGIGETILKIEATDTKIRVETRFHPDERVEFDRKQLIEDRNEVELNVKIQMLDGKCIVSFGVLAQLPILPIHDPLWAINYTYITGDLMLKEKNPVNVQCAKEKKPAGNGSVDWSNKLGIEKPTDIMFRGLQFKDNGTLFVYLLKGCSKFDMTVCNFAMEFELSFDTKNDGMFFINLHRRSSKVVDAFERKIGILHYVFISRGHKHDVTMSVYHADKMGLLVHGSGWYEADSIPEEEDPRVMENWKMYTNDHADFVQILTKGSVEVDNWTFYSAPRKVESMNKDKDSNPIEFHPGITNPPWNMEQKVTNWANGDYIKLHIRMFQYAPKIVVQLIFYRGIYPGWINDPNKSDGFGQIMLYLEIKQLKEESDAEVVFKADNCPWINSKERNCQQQQLDIEKPKLPGNQSKRFQGGQEYVLYIKAIKNKGKPGKYANGLQVEVFDPKNNNTLLATYTPGDGPPAYAIEHFTVENGDLELMEEPKFCKKGDKMC